MKFKCEKTGIECEHATAPDHYVQGQYCLWDRHSPRPIITLKNCPSKDG